MSIGIAFKAFFKALFNRDFSQRVAALFSSPDAPLLPEPQAPPAKTYIVAPGAVQVLGLLQREGRLIDFLQEDLSQASDAQIGAVVKSTVYSGCRQVLQKYITLEPVMDQNSEGEQVTVPTGFDPATIRLVGQVEGDPPFNGVLRHKGWKITAAQLPDLTPENENGIVCPAEVEIQ